MILRLLDWGNQDISFGDFIGLAFVTALDELARDIALIEPDPQDWVGWVTYLLEQLEEEAQRRGKQAEFVKMLEHLKKDIDN